MKRLSILGSTGSIGTNVLNIVAMFPQKFDVKVLAAKKMSACWPGKLNSFILSWWPYLMKSGRRN